MIKIYMTGYNSEHLIVDAINSIVTQTFTDWELQVIIDPLEGSSTGIFAKNFESNKIKVHLNEIRLGLTTNVLASVEMLTPSNEDIIICVDSDDKLASNDVLQQVWDTYFNNKALSVCYGGIVVEEDNSIHRIPFFRAYTTKELNNVRQADWHGTHLRTMKYKVWKNIPDGYMRDDNGDYFHMSNDLALMVSAIEIAGSDRVGYFDFPTYVYRPPTSIEHLYYKNPSNNTSTASDNSKEESRRLEMIIKSKKPLQRIKYFNTFSFVIYVKGTDLLATMEKSIQEVRKHKIDCITEFILVELHTGETYSEAIAQKYKYRYVPFDISTKINPNISTLGRNIGMLSSTADFAIVHDADLLINTNFFDTVAEMANSHQYFSSWSEINYQKKDSSGYNKNTVWRTNQFTYSNGGSLTINRDLFTTIGGYDSIFRGWGTEDNDFNFRASIKMGYPAPCADNKLVHMWHPSNTLGDNDHIRISNNNIMYYRMKKYGYLLNI